MVRTHEKRGVQEKRQGLRERFDLRVNCLECAEEVGFQRRPEKVGGGGNGLLRDQQCSAYPSF